MRTLLCVVLLSVCALAAGEDLRAEAIAGSQLPLEDNVCATCHGEPDLWEADTLRLYMPLEDMALDVHLKAGVNCHDCHGGDPSSFDVPEAHSVEAPEGDTDIAAFRFPLSTVREVCGNCHQEQQAELNVGGMHVSTVGARAVGPTADAAVTEPDCISCHAQNVHRMRSIDDPESPANPANLMETCGKCHAEALVGLSQGVHADKKRMAEHGEAEALSCASCHGKKAHRIVPVQDSRSPVSLNDQIRLCGKCHAGGLASYRENTHGLALENSGLSVTAVCADCHGAHGIFSATDSRSTLHEETVGLTCGKCHKFLEERIQKSVHGIDPEADEDILAEEAKPKPTCIVCHKDHESASPQSRAFRFGVSDQCSDCHADLYPGYAISMHGSLTTLGYGPAATCADCHGFHDILPSSDPDSKLSDANRLETCQECHPSANQNFADFDPHSDHRNSARDPIVYWVYVVLMTLLISTFSIFGLHSLLWCTRSFIEVRMHGRPKALKPGTTAFVRFKAFDRVAHTVMVLSFLGLALTGLPLKYSQLEWAKTVAHILGGFESTAVAHRIFGLVNGSCLVVYAFLMLYRVLTAPANGKTRLGLIFGPDSPLPSFRDVRDVFRVIRWFIGLGPKPTFERWTYWEKVDLWGASADTVIIGATGLVLWFPVFFCSFLPGEVLNIAKVIHSTQALLATGFVFTIHFISTHLRPEKFPMDLAVLTGLVSEEDMEEERPEYLERMRREGKLEKMKAIVPPRDVLWMIKLGGFVGLAIGLALLAGILIAVLTG